MATTTLTASFGSRQAADRAGQQLRRLGVPLEEIHIADGPFRRRDAHTVDRLLVARVDEACLGLALLILTECGADAVKQKRNAPRYEDWLNHHSEHGVTTSGVPPGQGDAECGTDDPSRRF